MNEKEPGYVDLLQDQACNCPGSISDNFLQPCVLLLLHRNQEAYGYGLIEALRAYGVAPDASVLYRNLRKMEKEGLLESTWDTEGPGPAKRIYRLTPGGEEYFHIWAATVRQNRNQLNFFLKEYERASKKPAPKGP